MALLDYLFPMQQIDTVGGLLGEDEARKIRQQSQIDGVVIDDHDRRLFIGFIHFCIAPLSSRIIIQHLADGFRQLRLGHGFHQISFDPHRPGQRFIAFIGKSRTKNDRDVGSNRHHFLCQCFTVHFRHAPVAEDEIEAAGIGREHGQGFQSAGAGSDPVAEFFEGHLLHVQDGRFIIDQQDVLGPGGI